MSIEPIEFDCVHCGRHIISIGNQSLQKTHPNTCAACWSMPEWYLDPELAKILDPDYEVGRDNQHLSSYNIKKTD